MRATTAEICEWFDDVLDEQAALLPDFSQLAALQAEEREALETVTPEDEETRRRVDQLTRVVERLALTSEEQEQKLEEQAQKFARTKQELAEQAQEFAEELLETREKLTIAENKLARVEAWQRVRSILLMSLVVRWQF